MIHLLRRKPTEVRRIILAPGHGPGCLDCQAGTAKVHEPVYRTPYGR